jgi:hypothetical protein
VDPFLYHQKSLDGFPPDEEEQGQA